MNWEKLFPTKNIVAIVAWELKSFLEVAFCFGKEKI